MFQVAGDLTPLNSGLNTLNQIGPSVAADYSVPLYINVPEPSGVAFAAVSGLGLGCLVFARWRNRRPARGA